MRPRENRHSRSPKSKTPNADGADGRRYSPTNIPTKTSLPSSFICNPWLPLPTSTGLLHRNILRLDAAHNHSNPPWLTSAILTGRVAGLRPARPRSLRLRAGPEQGQEQEQGPEQGQEQEQGPEQEQEQEQEQGPEQGQEPEWHRTRISALQKNMRTSP